MATALLIVASVIGGFHFLRLDTDWLVLFDSQRPEIAALRQWRQALPGSKDMAVIISGGKAEERKAAALKLGQAFEAEKELLESPLASLSTDIFVESGLYFLDPEQLLQLERDSELAISGTRELDLSQTPSVVYVTEILARSFDGSEILARGLEAFVTATAPNNADDVMDGLIPKLEPESQEVEQYLGQLDQVPSQAFLSLDGGKTLLVLVRPNIGDQALEASGPAVETVRRIRNDVSSEFQTLHFSLTGEPVLVVDERLTIARDSVRGTLCSLVLVLVLFRFGFREFLRPSLALASLLVGLLWTFGLISVTIGHLNFITITYVPILVGIGLDFGIHMAFRFFEHRSQETAECAMASALEGAGKDTFFGALTTSAAFGVLWLIGFRGVSELGAIALTGVLLCQISSCTFLPACLGWLESRGLALPVDGRQELSEVENQLCRFDRPMLVATAILFLVSLFYGPKVGFNVHLLKMQNPALESVQTELRLVAEGKSSVLTALVEAPDLETARRLEREIRALPTVAEVISLATFLPDVTPKKRRAVDSIIKNRPTLLELLRFVENTPPARAKEALSVMQRFESLKLPTPRSRAVTGLLRHLESRLKERGPGPVMDAFEEVRSKTLASLRSFEPLLVRQKTEPLEVKNLPDSLKGRLLRKDGGYVLKIFPKVDIWRPEHLHEFLTDIRNVSPEVSGEPVLIELFERLVLRTHWRGIALSLAAMLVVLGLILKKPYDVLLAGAPTALSLTIVMGFMGFFGWDFNPANFVAVPMLLGIGSVFGLHSVIRMRELGHEGLLSCSTGPAIALSAATSMAGFASLGLADHRGIASLGWLVAMGLLVNSILSIWVLPAWQRLRKSRA